MLRRAFALLGLLPLSSAVAAPPYKPYAAQAANDIYNLLFCDDLSAFEARAGQTPAPWQELLAAKSPDISRLSELAANRSEDGRVRYLAFARLRSLGQRVRPKELLGVIVEMPLSGGLDTLDAYSEGSVRYVNQSGKLVLVEGVSSFKVLVEKLFSAAHPIVTAIGPWDKPRRAPPPLGHLRLTFLVSDGLYFGEGPAESMHREPAAAAVLARATDLLQAVVAAPRR